MIFMGVIKVTKQPDFSKTLSVLKNKMKIEDTINFDEYGIIGVNILREHSPVSSGRLRSSWRYKIEKYFDHTELIFLNDDIEDGQNIAVLIAYDHATRNGRIVKANSYLKDSAELMIERFREDGWEEVR